MRWLRRIVDTLRPGQTHDEIERELVSSRRCADQLFTLAGLVIGVGLTVVAARATHALFYDFQPDYISAIAVASLALLAVAAFASTVPERRASRIDPMIALQRE